MRRAVLCRQRRLARKTRASRGWRGADGALTTGVDNLEGQPVHHARHRGPRPGHRGDRHRGRGPGAGPCDQGRSRGAAACLAGGCSRGLARAFAAPPRRCRWGAGGGSSWFEYYFKTGRKRLKNMVVRGIVPALDTLLARHLSQTPRKGRVDLVPVRAQATRRLLTLRARKLLDEGRRGDPRPASSRPRSWNSPAARR